MHDMGFGNGAELAYVTYRATGGGRQPVEVHLVMVPSAATVADAWSRLTQIDPTVDPYSLEIESRRVAPRVVPLSRRPRPKSAFIAALLQV